MLAIVVAGCGGGKDGADAVTDTQQDGVTDTVDDAARDTPDGDEVDQVECTRDEDCQNGVFCDGQEACVDGECMAGGEACDDLDPCTTDLCDEGFEECEHPDLDADEDGYVAAEGPAGEACGGTDCDDGDPGRNPSISPGCSDIDDLDCNGEPDQDNDGDGYDDVDCGGDDCDDSDPTTNPGAAPQCDGDHDCNGIEDGDNDDDGQDASEPAPGRDCGGTDCIDSDPLSFERVAQAGHGCLDGIDNNCDGIADNPVRKLAVDISVAFGGSTIDSGTHPNIEWTGSFFAVAYDTSYDVMPTERYQDLVVFNVNPNGTWHPADTSEITDDIEFDFKPRIAWTGSDLVLTWMREHDASASLGHGVYFQRFSGDWGSAGYPARAVVGGTTSVDSPQIAWTGSEFGIAWEGPGPETDSAAAIYFDIVDLEGITRLPSPLLVGDTRGDLDDHWPHLDWSGSEFAVTWQVEVESTVPSNAAFMTVGIDGTLGLAEPAMLTDDATLRNFFPRVAWAGSAWAVTWTRTVDYSTGDILVALVDGAGSMLGAPAMVNDTAGNAFMSVPAWTGSSLVLSWVDIADGQYHAGVLDASLSAILGDGAVSNTTGQVMFQEMAWSGSEFGIVWQDARFGSPRVFMNIVGFCD